MMFTALGNGQVWRCTLDDVSVGVFGGLSGNTTYDKRQCGEVFMVFFNGFAVEFTGSFQQRCTAVGINIPTVASFMKKLIVLLFNPSFDVLDFL